MRWIRRMAELPQDVRWIRCERALAGGRGFEPRLTESESVVLPLDDPPAGAAARHPVSRDRASGSGRNLSPGLAGFNPRFALRVRSRLLCRKSRNPGPFRG